MTSLRELKTEEELKKWGIEDAKRETEKRQNLSKAAGKFHFVTKGCRRKAKPSTCSLRAYALNKYVMQLVSRPNAATYLLESVNYASACTDFRKLIGFLDTYPEPGKSELATLVFPVFVYFYLLLLKSGPSGHLDAKSFYKKNKVVFADEESYEAVLEALFSFTNWADVKKDSYFKNFLECKYIIGISSDVLLDLKKFIENDAEEEGDKALLYVLHFHFHFQDVDEAEYIDSTIEDSRIPILEGDGYEWVELEDPTSISESMDVQEQTSVSKPTEKESVSNADPTSISESMDVQVQTSVSKPTEKEAVSNSDPTSNRLPVQPKSSNSGNDTSKLKDGEPESELNTLITLLTLNHPRISTVVTRCIGTTIRSVDFNDGETEIAYAIGNNKIYVAPLGIVEEVTEIDDFDAGPGPSKRKRVGEQKIHIPTGSHRKGSKTVKTSRSGKHLKPPRGTKRKKGTKSNEDDNSCLERNMKVIDLPEIGEIVEVIKYLPERSHLLLAACNDKVRLLNTRTECFLADYQKHKGTILDIDINSTSEYFATAHIDKVTCLYNFHWSWDIQTYGGHVDAVTCVRFHPNGIYIATGSKDSSVRLYDVDSGLCIRRFSDYEFAISSMAFSPDGKFLATADVLGDVRVWNIKDGSKISTVKFCYVLEPLEKISCMCFQSDSSVIMAGNLKGECRLWDIRKPVEEAQILHFRNRPLKIKHCKNGKWKMALQEEVL